MIVLLFLRIWLRVKLVNFCWLKVVLNVLLGKIMERYCLFIKMLILIFVKIVVVIVVLVFFNCLVSGIIVVWMRLNFISKLFNDRVNRIKEIVFIMVLILLCESKVFILVLLVLVIKLVLIIVVILVKVIWGCLIKIMMMVRLIFINKVVMVGILSRV